MSISASGPIFYVWEMFFLRALPGSLQLGHRPRLCNQIHLICRLWICHQWHQEAGVSQNIFGQHMAFPGGARGANARRHKRCRFDPWVRKIPGRRKWQPTPVFLPGKFHGLRSLMGYGSWCPKSQTWLKQLSMHAWDWGQQRQPHLIAKDHRDSGSQERI